jgi:hypothetical protein
MSLVDRKILFSVLSTGYGVLCIVYSIWGTVYSVQYMGYCV